MNLISIKKRFELLEQYLDFLTSFQKIPLDEFVIKPEFFGATERFLQLSIEALDDIGNNLIASRKLGNVDTYSDIPRRLFADGLINENQCQQWNNMVGFRNLLVHDYVKIDRTQVYLILQSKLHEVREIAARLVVAILE